MLMKKANEMGPTMKGDTVLSQIIRERMQLGISWGRRCSPMDEKKGSI